MPKTTPVHKPSFKSIHALVLDHQLFCVVATEIWVKQNCQLITIPGFGVEVNYLGLVCLFSLHSHLPGMIFVRELKPFQLF